MVYHLVSFVHFLAKLVLLLLIAVFHVMLLIFLSLKNIYIITNVCLIVQLVTMKIIQIIHAKIV